MLGQVSAAGLREDFLLTKWETEDGLPENSATAMVQTREGYLWFGTFNGLVRTDGQQLTVFDRGNTPALPDTAIINVHLQPSGRMWVSTRKGLVSLHNGVWKRHGEGTAWTNRMVWSFAGNARGALLATSFDGALCRIEGDTVEELPAPLPPPVVPPVLTQPVGAAFHGHVDPAGGLWAVRRDFFGRWGGQRWVQVAAAGVTNDFRCAGPARDGGLWVLTKTELIKLAAGKVERTLTLTGEVTNPWTLTEDVDGTLWVASHRDGLFRITQAGAVTRFTTREGLTVDSVRFAFRAQSGALWVGTASGGLMRLRARTVRTFDTETALAVRSTRSVAEAGPGRILMGTYGGGVARLDLNGPAAELSVVGSGRSLVQALLVDRQGRQWTGFFSAGLSVTENGVERRLSAEQAGGRQVNALLEDRAGVVWIGGSESVVRETAGKFERVPGLPGAEGFAQHPVDGGLWAVSRRGLFRLEKDAWREVAGPGGKPLPEGTCLGFEANGMLWVGTMRDGLFRLHNGKWAGTGVGARHGLASDSVRGLVDDLLGQWWLTSNRGVTRVTKASLHAVAEGRSERLEAQVLTVADGMASMECPRGTQPSSLRDSAGRLWFATVKGVAMVDPAKFQVDRKLPRVVIESSSYVDSAGKRQVTAQPASGPVQVPPGSGQFEVSYTALGAPVPERFRFRLNWRSGDRIVATTETSERSAHAALLPPGNYTLQVLVANRHGVWGTEPAELAFVMQPHYWQTWGFRIGVGLAGLAAAGLGLLALRRGELRRREVELAHERALMQEQARFASVMEGTSDAVAFISPELVVSYLNPAGRRMFGVGDAELGGQLRFREFYPLAAAKYVVETAFPQALAQGTWNGELHMVRRDGREFPVSQVVVAHRNAAGEFQFLSTIIRNLSERKQSEDALAAALKHARLLATLGRKLAEADSSTSAAQLIMEAADDLIGWDAAWVRRWRPDKYRFERLIGWDTVDGQRREFGNTTGEFDVGSALVREVMAQGAKLILRGGEEESVPGLRPFGGARRSRSLMFVPMRHAGQVVGVLSVQSYRAEAYHATHLELLQALADHCAGNLQRLHAEHALRASLDQWRMAMGVARLGTWEWDLHTNVVHHSPELAAMFGGPDLVNPLQTEADFHQFIHAEDQAGVEAAIQVAIAQRTPYHHEFRVVWQNGSVHWIEGRGEIFPDGDGQPARFVGVSADVTDRRVSDDALHQSETRFRNLVTNMSEGLLMTDFEDVILFANGRVTDILGYPPAELLGRKGYEVFMTPAGKEIMAERHRLRRQGEREVYELPLRHKDGRTIWVETHASPYCDADGKITATLGAITDITERRQLEGQLRQSQKMEGIGQLAGGVAHDFNNLLTIIQGHLFFLLERPDLAPEARDAITEIGASATQAANLTRQLLTFSRRQPFKLTVLDLNLAVTAVSRMLQRLVGEHVRLELHLAPQPIGAHADASMIEQALMNLILNARDALPGGGAIHVATASVELDELAAAQTPAARPGHFVTLTVSDTGRGIAPEVLPHIFEPFFTTKEVGQGTGLGLATVFGIVQQHHGWITVYSEPGHGTTFRLYLPWCELPVTAPPPPPPTLAQTPGGTETILVVEDELAVRNFITKVLKRLGYRVLEAPSGRAALEVWAAHRADIRLLVTDLVMPDGISGRELSEQLHAERPELPVIYISGYSADVAGQDFPLAEGENFLSKPFDLTALAALVRQRLDGATAT